MRIHTHTRAHGHIMHTYKHVCKFQCQQNVRHYICNEATSPNKFKQLCICIPWKRGDKLKRKVDRTLTFILQLQWNKFVFYYIIVYLKFKPRIQMLIFKPAVRDDNVVPVS